MVCDMHPDYHSSAFAEKLHSENKGSILLKVQHHHAHIVSCMEDNVLEGEVIGVSFDGTGYGDDGRSWGGEFLLCSKSEFCRMFHLKYIPQPGADKAASEGWRMALAYLYGAFGPGFYMVDSPVLKRLEKKRILTVGKMINKNINSPLTSSMGRLFDAVSSLIGVCDVSVFSGEAAMLLEEAAVSGINEVYNYEVSGEDICVFQMIREIISDMNKGISPGIISAKFHNTVAEIIFDISNRIYQLSGVNKVVVSGGCFLNKYIVNTIRDRFDKSSLDLFTHKKFSPGDSGLSVGQIVVADSM
jgi:hydrogenase maturation protein HypF